MKAFLIAGEPSGDRLGAALIAGLRELDPALEVRGIGGEGMAAQGLVEREGSRLRVTDAGMPVLEAILRELMIA